MATNHNKPATGYPAPPPAGQPSYAMGPGPAAYNSGYPQPYPTYPAYHPPAPNPYNGRFSRDSIFFRRILAVILTLAIIAGIVILITWLALRPHRPKFHIDGADVSQLNITGGRLNSHMVFNISARNPNNKIGVYYDAMSAKVNYDGRVIGYNLLPEFYQGHKNTSVMACPLSADQLLLEGSVSNHLADDLARKKVPMTVKLEAWIRFKVGKWTTRHYDMEVYCYVDIDWDGKSGRLSSPKRCDVEI